MISGAGGFDGIARPFVQTVGVTGRNAEATLSKRRGHDDVMVVDARQQYVGHVHWAVARRALREKRARVWKREPYVIMLPVGERSLPTFAGKDESMTANLNELRGPAVMNWLNFFKEERDIWCQNISATQLSMSFDIAPGQPQGVLVPVLPHPICLTQEVPFDAIKKSMDFRKFLNKVPAVLRLLSEEQVTEYMTQYARQNNLWIVDPVTGKRVPDVGAAIRACEAERASLRRREGGDDTVIDPATGQVRFSPPRSALELMNINNGGVPGAPDATPMAHQASNGAVGGFANVGQNPIMMDQVIHPRVLNLCQQVSMQLDANLRMPQEEFMKQLGALKPLLKVDDLQYIEAFGTYRKAKQWASSLLAERAAAATGEGLEEDGSGALAL